MRASGNFDWTGEVWTAEVFECENDIEGIVFAKELSKRWRSRVKLYRVPFVNTTGVASETLWPEQVSLILDIPPLPDTVSMRV